MALVDEHEVVEVVVGLPRTLAGREGPAAQKAQDYATPCARACRGGADVPVVLSDERLTTVTAMRTLSDRGVQGPQAAQVIDQAAAVGILQGYLDARRARPAGGATAEDT